MKLSAPVYRLKRKARHLSRKATIPLHAALDRVAAEEGFASWSLLASSMDAAPAAKLLSQLSPGDLLLVGARPGHGKTLLSLELAVEAMRSGHRGVFFTLEYTAKDILDRFRAIGVTPAEFDRLFAFDNSDTIDADYIVHALQPAPRGTLAVVDYLQLLDQRRENAELTIQVQTLRRFARDRGIIFVFISQIDRSFELSDRRLPDVRDVRLPNPLDLRLFDKMCFLSEGEVWFGMAQ